MAQKLKFGNGTWATKEGSTLAYNDENNNYKPLPFTTTRNSIATRVNKQGLIEVVGNDVPRIDYTDSADGVFLLENSATNLITYSEDFSNSFWLIQNLSVTLNSIISPNGNLNATKLIENTSNSTHRILNGSGLTVSGNVSMSVFAKKGERNWIRLTNNIIQGAFFDLDNGIVGDVISGINAKIENYGNGWYRCSISQTGVANERLGIYTSIDGVNTTYQGDGTSGVYIYGAMLEENSVASSYIPTQGSAVTRVADTASGAGNSEVFNDSEGVLFADVSGLVDDGTTRYIAISDGSNNERVQIIYNSILDNIAMSVVSSNTGQASATAITSQTQYSKLAIKYKVNDCSFWFNGFKIHTDTSAVMPSGLDVLEYQRPNNTSPFYGKTKEIGYYNTALTDAELETLTSYRNWVSMVNELNLNIIYNG